jgi:hypothetical protein
VLYHSGAELVSDWPAIFGRQGFRITEGRDIINETLPTWAHARAVYEQRAEEVTLRYGRRFAQRTFDRLGQIAEILSAYGTVPSFSAQKPAAKPSNRRSRTGGGGLGEPGGSPR